LKDKGYTDITGPRPVIEQSFQDAYISDGDNWMKMIQSRNLTSHTYNEETANEIVYNIKNIYIGLFRELKQVLDSIHK
jgi:nucleotidyltransferase substrate binding protein (TIGR01987 family)